MVVSIKGDNSTGCASVGTLLGPSYVPQNPVQRMCTLPWDWLGQQAASASGLPSLNLQQTIQSDLPSSLASNSYLQAALAQNPVSSCYDPLSAPPPDPVGSSEQTLSTNQSQPFPFYGWITVSWGS